MFIFLYLVKSKHITLATIERLKHLTKHTLGLKIVK